MQVRTTKPFNLTSLVGLLIHIAIGLGAQSFGTAAFADICKDSDVLQLLQDAGDSATYKNCAKKEIVSSFTTSARELLAQHSILMSAEDENSMHTSEQTATQIKKLRIELKAIEAIDFASEGALGSARNGLSTAYEAIETIMAPFSTKSADDFPGHPEFCGMMLEWKRSKLWADRLSACPRD